MICSPTQVFYAVLWGIKIFVVAPPTPHNMRLMQSWQLRDESERDTRFPQACSVHAVGLGLGVCSSLWSVQPYGGCNHT